ncbi:sphingolipid Delta4-desaturase-domain-containing protein [Hyaloraphidium curvatum]|nr:sphingolipid Delta4-desaturase-domain-containing protein [Hyaloraphidium curvatum]
MCWRAVPRPCPKVEKASNAPPAADALIRRAVEPPFKSRTFFAGRNPQAPLAAMGRIGDVAANGAAGADSESRRRRGAGGAGKSAEETDPTAALFTLDHKLDDFYWVHDEEPHKSRRDAMLKAHPELRKLMRHEPLTKWIVTAEVVAQFALAWWLSSTGRDWRTWEFWVIAYFIGGTITASLVLSIHEITHYLAFKAFLPNKILACIANLPIVLPFCVEFKRYHMDHHRFQGVDGIDGDLPSTLEAKFLNSVPGKLFFCTFQILFYAIRPKLVATSRTFRMPETAREWLTSWYSMNFAIQISVMLLTLKFWGFNAIFYLAASVLLGGSLHPMAGHFIAEHYVFSKGQETYSYYGWMNM